MADGADFSSEFKCSVFLWGEKLLAFTNFIVDIYTRKLMKFELEKASCLGRIELDTVESYGKFNDSLLKQTISCTSVFSAILRPFNSRTLAVNENVSLGELNKRV